MAASTFWARLIHGNKRLQLDEEPYMLGQNFSPPSVSRSVSYADSARRGSATSRRIDEKYSDKSWSFSLRVLADTEAEANGYISRFVAFLENIRDTNYPLQFEYYPYNATGCIPLWGQGAYRYTIKDATCAISSPWLMRDKFAIVTVSARIGPMVEGQRQRVALASGGIYEDTVKTPNGESRGVQVCTAGTNLCTNPIFSHATWNTGWSTSGDLLATKITNAEYPIFGDTCAKIQHNGATTGTANYTTTLTTAAATYVLSAYVKLLDERAPGTADMQLLCRGTALGAFNSISVGDNWYRIWDTAACPSAAGTVGIKLMNPGAACYFDGFQVELPQSRGTVPTPLMHGDALGCAWSGTRGASTTVRTVGALKLPVSAELVNSANSSIRMVTKWDIDSSQTYDDTLFSGDTAATSGIMCECTNGTARLQYGASLTVSKGLSFSIGDISVFHFSWGKTSDGQDQIALYVDGSGTASSVLDLSVWGTNLFIGSDDLSTSAYVARATVLDFTIFDRYLTAAEVAADYAQVSAHVNGGDGLGQALSRIPYLWTKDGDGVVDSYNDATHDDFAVINGVPGALPARATFDIRPTFAGTAAGGMVIANQTYKDYLDETNMYIGTVAIAQNVGTVNVAYPSGGTVIPITRQLDAYRGQKAYMLASIVDAGTTLCRGRMVVTYDTASNAYYSDYTSLQTDGTAAWYLIGPMLVPDMMPIEYDWMSGFGELNFYADLVRLSGSGTITMNSLRLIPGMFRYVYASGLTTNHGFILDENSVYSYNTSTSKEDGMAYQWGEPIYLIPGVYNHLIAVPMALNRDSNLADTATFSRVYVTPRYPLL
jgi:hypothetical protein